MPCADRYGSNASHQSERIRPAVWAVVTLSLLLPGGMLFTIEREPDVSRSANTARSGRAGALSQETLSATEHTIQHEDAPPVVALPLLDAHVANAFMATKSGLEPWQSGGAEEGTGGQDEVMRYAKSLLRTGSADALMELHRIIREEPEGERKRRLADVAAQWPLEPEVLPIALETLGRETDQEVLRSVKAMLREQVTQESLEAMVGLHDQSNSVDLKEKIEAIIRNITDRDAYDTLADIIFDRRFPLTDPLTAAAVESMSHLDTPAAVNRLLQRLNEAAPDENVEHLFSMLTAINKPEARTSLELAAQGMKEVENPVARAAAIYALRNYLDDATLSLWQTLVADQSDVVNKAAVECLTWAGGQEWSGSILVPFKH